MCIRDRAQLELALEEREDAVELGAIEAQAGLELAAQALDEGAPGAGQPSGGGGAMDAVEGGDAIDAEAIDDVVAEQVALACGERDERAAEGGAELGAVAPLQEGELGVGGVGDRVDVVDDGLAVLLAVEADGDPDRGDAEPGREARGAVEVADARRPAVLAEQEAQANELLSLI